MRFLLPALAGLAAGVLSGCGVGGGTLLILWLTLAAGMDQRQAGGVNLLYFTACAAPALWGHFKNKLVENRAALWAALAGVPACLAGAALANFLDTALLRRGFGLVLLWVGCRSSSPARRKTKARITAPPPGTLRAGPKNQTQRGELYWH